MNESGEALTATLAVRTQVCSGSLWDPRWFSQFDGIGCGELLTLEQPQVIADALRALLEAGADGVSTNTSGATSAVMMENGITQEKAAGLAWEANFHSAHLARRVAQEYSTPAQPRWVIGSMGPTLHCLTLMGGGQAKWQQIRNDYYQQARALWEGGSGCSAPGSLHGPSEHAGRTASDPASRKGKWISHSCPADGKGGKYRKAARWKYDFAVCRPGTTVLPRRPGPHWPLLAGAATTPKRDISAGCHVCGCLCCCFPGRMVSKSYRAG